VAIPRAFPQEVVHRWVRRVGLAYRRELVFHLALVHPPVLAYRRELVFHLASVRPPVLAYRQVAGSIRPVGWCRLREVVVM
jgi:hypothetical protein